MRHIALLVLLFVSVNLWASDSGLSNSGFYAGGSLGFSDFNDDGMGDNLSSDDDSGTLHLFGGYQFNPYLSAEAAIDALGYYESETPTADIDNSYSAVTVSLLGRMPLGMGFSAFVQGGGGIASIYQVVDGTIGSYYYNDDDASDSGFATVVGGGLSYSAPQLSSLEFRLGYLQTDFEVDAAAVNALGDLVENKYDQTIKQFYFGAAYHFN